VNDFIISLRSFQGGIEYSNYKGICSPAYIVLRKKRNEDVEFFFKYYFKTSNFIKDLNKNIEGIRDGKMISYNQFSDLHIVIPLNPKEQQKIASCLSSLDELIEAQTKKLETLRLHKKGLMQNLFPANGKATPLLRFPEFQFAPEWKEKPLGKIANILQGYGFPEKHQGITDGAYPFYKVSDISNSFYKGENFIKQSANYIDETTLKILKAKLLPVGTTIFAKIGEAIRLNRRVITTVPCLIDNNVAGLKRIEGQSTDLFLYYILLGINLADYCGGAVPSVNKSAIEAIIVICPEPEEQKKIADFLSSVDDLITAQSNKLETLRLHKKGLMQQLFPNVN
jgi:type I restriction enzyme S subunit